MFVVACASPKVFANKVVSTRKTEIKSIKDSIKKIASDEVSRCKTLFKEHVDFFKKKPETEYQPVESFNHCLQSGQTRRFFLS